MDSFFPKTVIVVAGPTAAGKTDLAVRIAAHFETSVISADSRQCYRELTIGTAKPPESVLRSVPHFFINSHSVTQPVNAGVFEQLALGYAAEIFRRRPVAVVCGGTGLYLRAFLEGIDDMPPVPEAVRLEIREFYRTEGLGALRDRLQKKDPFFFSTGETLNPHRLMRALEVAEATGKSITLFRRGQPKARDFRVVKIGLEWPRDQLASRIEARTRAMFEEGLVEEARRMLPFRDTPPLRTVGYEEVFSYLDGIMSLDAAEEFVAIHTRQYAKRQMTWFKKDGAIRWFEGTDPGGAMEHVLRETANFAPNR